MGMSYAKAGVDVGKVKGMHSAIEGMIKGTHSRFVLPIYGHYAGLIRAGSLTLAMHTDGVGTKVLVAHELRKYGTIGIDCVAMNVNDIICVGAKPIALVDYLALEHEDAPLARELMKGLVKGCREAGVSLIGGETAIMPDLIKGEKGKTGFDLAGTAIGVVEGEPITGAKMQPGDVVVGVESSGVHSNGLTLARKALPRKHWKELLTPTKIYVKPTLELLSAVQVHGLAHITGGGFSKLMRIGNYAKAGFLLDSMPKPKKVFQLIAEAGIPEKELYRTFNMGVGLCAVCPDREADEAISVFKKHKMEASVIGRITRERKVKINGETEFEV